MKVLITFSILVLSVVSVSETSANQKQADLLLQINDLKGSEYILKIDSLRKEVEDFIHKKRRVCLGEFSSLLLKDMNQEDSAPSEKTIKLTKSEQEVCLKEVIGLKIKLAESLYIARKNFFDYLHKKRADKLLDLKNQNINSLKMLKYGPI